MLKPFIPRAQELPLFDMTDQPETCRKCGTRTEFMGLRKQLQIHWCPECDSLYLLEDDATLQ